MAFNPKAAVGAAVAIVVVLALYITMPLSPEESSDEPSAVDAVVQANRTYLRVGAELTLDGSHSAGDIVEYRWNLGDGSSRTGVAITYSYDEVGKYHVSLTVTDGDGDADKDYIYVHVFEIFWYNGTVNSNDQENTHTFEVIWDERSEAPVQKAQGVDINLSYEATPEVGDENHLCMTVRSPDNEVVREEADQEGDDDSTNTRYARIVLDDQEMIRHGGDWEVTVEYDRGGLPPPGNSDIEYHLRIMVFY